MRVNIITNVLCYLITMCVSISITINFKRVYIALGTTAVRIDCHNKSEWDPNPLEQRTSGECFRVLNQMNYNLPEQILRETMIM